VDFVDTLQQESDCPLPFFKMKLYVNARFLTQPLSGVQRYAIECSRQIKKLFPEATFLSSNNILYNDLATELEVEIIGSRKGHMWEQIDLPMYLAKQKNPPLLNLANTAPLLYNNNYLTIHDLAFYHHPEWNTKIFSAWYNILIPRLVFKSRHIFTVSQTVKDEIVKYYGIPAFKITVTYNGISQNMLAEGSRSYAKEKVILSVGTFNIRKNHQRLVTAFISSGLKDSYQLVIIGDKYKVFRESSIDEKTIADNNIKIYSGLTNDELVAMYKLSEIVVSLSKYEGFGIPVLEGLYFGCRALCSDIPVYREIYEGHAMFCDPENNQSIVDALLNLSKGGGAKGEENDESLFKKYNYYQSALTILKNIEGR
jgi:glycosyltransferase involved in cell wall biosynthesis